MIKELPEYRPGQYPSAEELNRAMREIERQAQTTGQNFIEDGTGQHFRPLEPESLWIKIGVQAADPRFMYAWKAQIDTIDAITTGNMEDVPGLRGTVSPVDLPAFEVNFNVHIQVGTVVRAWKGEGRFYRFEYCCG